MPSNKRTDRSTIQPPEIVPGNWQGELLGSGTLNFGQVVQPGPPRQSVEFTYVILSAILETPDRRFTWPGVITIMTPTPMKVDKPDAGRLLKSDSMPSLFLSLETTRAQLTDMIGMLDTKRLKNLHFTVESQIEGSWPIYSWGMSTTFVA